MLSIGAMKSGQVDYYQCLAKEDYYLEGGEPPGQWLGTGAAQLGLSGQVHSRDLSALFQGFTKSGKKLVQNAGKPNRQPGWDLTFSAPKSVSVLWSQLDSAHQREVQAAHSAAVGATVEYIEKNFCFSRIGKAGVEQAPAHLVVASFEHSCSRALDPQLHSHCLVMNLGVDTTGAVRSIRSKPLYQAKMLCGAFYRCELARQLQERLGIGIERPLNRDGIPRPWFEVSQVPRPVLEYFSKRRAAIEAKLESHGLESASAAAFAALSTRTAKTVVPPRTELHARWRGEGLALGFSADDLLSRPQLLSPSMQDKRFRDALQEAVAAITFSENYFTKEDLLQRTLEAAQGRGVAAGAIASLVEAELQRESTFISLGARNGQQLWTTAEILQVESEFREAIDELRNRPFVPIPEPIVSEAVEKARGVGANAFVLDAEQQAAVRYLTQDQAAIKVVTGFAGTGKTDMLAAAKEALERGGYRVIGTALAAVAARTLQEKTGIEADTVRMRELQFYPELKHRLKHHAKQLVRAAAGKPTFQFPRLCIDAKTVLVIDEAGMIGTRDFALLVRTVVDQGGSVIAVGDEKQLPSIERGGCLDTLVKSIDGVRLTEIRRQADPADRQAVKDVLMGEPQAALFHYAEKGQFLVARTRAETEAALISDWSKNGGTKTPADHRIFAGTRAEVDHLNRLAQWERVNKGFVNGGEYVEHAGGVFMVGDQVRFNLAAKTLGIQKGERGTVIACKDGILGKYIAVSRHETQSTLSERSARALKHHARQLIRAALGRRTEKLPLRRDIVLVPLQKLNPFEKTYQGLSLDYAMTTHLGQGQTVKNSYVLMGGKMTDRELSYVQTSRHQGGLFLYAQQTEAGKTLTEAARRTWPLPEINQSQPDDLPDHSSLLMQMKLSRAKLLAADVDQRPLKQENPHAL